jgi:hypothetical protein
MCLAFWDLMDSSQPMKDYLQNPQILGTSMGISGLNVYLHISTQGKTHNASWHSMRISTRHTMFDQKNVGDGVISEVKFQ